MNSTNGSGIGSVDLGASDGEMPREDPPLTPCETRIFEVEEDWVNCLCSAKYR